MAPPVLNFTERLARRSERWYGWTPLGERLAQRDAIIHRQRERRTFRSHKDPPEAWHCCQYWQRTLYNKWNSREFAIRHGCQVPELYWHGASSENPSLEALPSHFVVRAVFGDNGRTVLVMADGTDLYYELSAPGAKRFSDLPRASEIKWGMPILIEEFVRSEDGAYRFPLEYKCHVFGASVGAVEVIERTGLSKARHRYYTPDWQPFAEPVHVGLREEEFLREPPRFLAEMLDLAGRFGASLATYARLDFFATDRGCVFNEFTEIPFFGKNFTPFCDEYFGALWAENIPDAV